MKKTFKNSVFGALLASTALSGAASAEDVSLEQALKDTKILVNTRLAYERVDQDGFANKANALTFRVRAGIETGKFLDTSFLVDMEHIEGVAGNYNSTTNGMGTYPVVPDPQETELNRLQLTNTSLPDTKITIGRQRIKLDNDRFVGNVGWRQNEQTYDAIRVENTSISGLKLDFTYIDQVNRIFGKGSPNGRFESESYLINAMYTVPSDTIKLKLGVFGYLLDLSAAAVSSQTYGFQGSLGKGPFTLSGVYANQSDYANQPTPYDVNYYSVKGAFAKNGFSASVEYEVLGGDGTKGFYTPLATLHAFNGWADAFLLATPANGLEDLQINVAYATKKVPGLKLAKLGLVYHEYSSDIGSTDYGSEVGVVAIAAFDRFKFITKYADYNGSGFQADRNKLWIRLEFDY